MQVTAIRIPLPLALSGAAALLTLSTKRGAQPLFDSREIAPLKRVVAWQVAQGSFRLSGQGGSLRPEFSEHSGTAPTPGMGSIVSPPRGRPPEATGEREAYLRPGTPVVHLLSKSSHASADSRGRLAPTSGRRAKHRPGTARLPRAGSGSASAGFFVCACARVRVSGARASCLGRWAGTDTGRGHLYLCWPATATSASGTRLRTATWPPSVATFPSEEEGVPWRAAPQCRLRGYRKACAPKTTMGTFPSVLLTIMFHTNEKSF